MLQIWTQFMLLLHKTVEEGNVNKNLIKNQLLICLSLLIFKIENKKEACSDLNTNILKNLIELLN